ncbi:hypothetical protein [Streptomyces alanosinicus]|uniref:Uncharacterized protein n=1 Tax=Streptomyces alanosinicus TaxID=68171 RepID=A0A918YN70_9ACTN|nr:hypothetical protein [Streptomyces alanosinicus]GHE09255.1 hypothetical protein GCM10010339_60930 [Streptomyces alanosinicus]
MKLDLPDFELNCDEAGRLTFFWHRYGKVSSHVGNCSQLRLLPQGSDGLSQWVFHLRFPEGPTPGFVMVRVDVPADRQEEVQVFTDLLRRCFSIPEIPEVPEPATDTAEESGLQRVPLDTAEWLAAPASSASEELFATVTARVDGATG